MTALDYRRHCEDFTTAVAGLCTDPGVRRDLRDGRGRAVTECLRMHRYLTVRTADHGHRRAHYTLASLIALADPLAELRNQPTPAPRSPITPPARAPLPDAQPQPDPFADPKPAPTAGADTALESPDSPDHPYTAAVWRARPNLGATLARAVTSGGFNEDRTDNLLHTIVLVDDDHLHPHILPSLTDRLLRAGITPDWPVLLEDLSLRAFDAEKVATRWLDSFYLTLTHTPTRQGPTP